MPNSNDSKPVNIGAFGKLRFRTSAEALLTFDKFRRKSRSNFVEHPVLDSKPRLEHTGFALDEVSFSVLLDISLDINPALELKSVREMLVSGTSYPLVMKDKDVGNFVLTDLEESWTRIDSAGRLLAASLNLTLKEV